MRSPLGFGPHTELPSGFLLELDTNVQVPTSCSLRVFCCAATSPTCKRIRTSAISAVTLIVRQLLMVLLPLPGSPDGSRADENTCAFTTFLQQQSAKVERFRGPLTLGRHR